MSAARTFSPADQRAFAGWSGDHNPIHLDPRVARRSPFGAPLVHGVHLVLWAIDALLPAGSAIVSIEAILRRPVRVDEEVTATGVDTATALAITLETASGPVTTVDVGLGWPGTCLPMGTKPPSERSDDVRSEPLAVGHRGRWPLVDVAAVARSLPRLARALTPGQLAATLAVSAIVGMRCPGERSTLSSFRLRFGATSPGGAVEYEVVAVDERFDRATIEVAGGGCEGEIVAFRRPPPVQQPTLDELAGRVDPDEFTGTRALVIGGSRGLGEVAAKLLAAGGADVVLTSRSGTDDALRVAAELSAVGASARPAQFEAAGAISDMDAAVTDVCVGGWAPTLLAYFATPPIFTGGPRFSPSLQAQFTDVLVTAPVALIEHFAGSLRAVLIPSSTVLDHPVAGLAEYAGAKAAAEVAVAAAAARHGIHAEQPRWPRLATDQTISQLPVDNAEPLPYVLAALRAAHARR